MLCNGALAGIARLKRRLLLRGVEVVPSDPKSKHWKKLRARRLAMDGFRSVVSGCGQRATTVEHIKRRRDGGADTNVIALS
jgi:hypothetical protein